jgi:hypothetical protein
MYVPSGGLFDELQAKRTTTSPFGERRVSEPDPSPVPGTSDGPRVPQYTSVGIGELLFATVGAGALGVGLTEVVGVAVGPGDASTVDTGACPRATYKSAMNRTVTSTTTATNDTFLMLGIAARWVPLGDRFG